MSLRKIRYMNSGAERDLRLNPRDVVVIFRNAVSLGWNEELTVIELRTGMKIFTRATVDEVYTALFPKRPEAPFFPPEKGRR